MLQRDVELNRNVLPNFVEVTWTSKEIDKSWTLGVADSKAALPQKGRTRHRAVLCGVECSPQPEMSLW